MRKRKKKWRYDCIAKYWACKNSVQEVYESIFFEDDLIGRKIGKWIILKRVKYKKWKRYYLCKCSCSKEAIVAGEALRRGKSYACRSCSAKQRWKDRKLKSIHERKKAKENKLLEKNEESSTLFKYYSDEETEYTVTERNKLWY